MDFESKRVRLGDLRLDNQNPRFIITPRADESAIITYLLSHENIITLATDIAKFGGLIPGERPIVILEGPRYVVLEGNRRICACKLLFDRKLIPSPFLNQFPVISDELKRTIDNVDVDVVSDREVAQPLLYVRHLKGVKNWSTFSKDNFFASQFHNQGLSVNEIANVTSTTVSEVRDGIKEFHLIKLALDSPLWTSEENKRLNLVELKLAPYLRTLNAKSPKYKTSGMKLLEIEFDKHTLAPTSTLDTEVFNEAIYLLAKESFFNPKFTTRSHLESIGKLDALISSLIEGSNNDDKRAEKSNESQADGGEDFSKKSQRDVGEGARAKQSASGTNKTPQSEIRSNDKADGERSAGRLMPAPFFQNLRWNGLNPSNPDHEGLVTLASEIKSLSTNGHYRRYPVTTAMLLRALLEQSLKYHLKKIGEWSNVSGTASGYDPMLRKIIGFYKKSNNFRNFFGDRNLASAFETTTADDVIALLDTNIHNSQYARVNKDELERISSKGAFALINGILNLS